MPAISLPLDSLDNFITELADFLVADYEDGAADWVDGFFDCWIVVKAEGRVTNYGWLMVKG